MRKTKFCFLKKMGLLFLLLASIAFGNGCDNGGGGGSTSIPMYCATADGALITDPQRAQQCCQTPDLKTAISPPPKDCPTSRLTSAANAMNQGGKRIAQALQTLQNANDLLSETKVAENSSAPEQSAASAVNASADKKTWKPFATSKGPKIPNSALDHPPPSEAESNLFPSASQGTNSLELSTHTEQAHTPKKKPLRALANNAPMPSGGGKNALPSAITALDETPQNPLLSEYQNAIEKTAHIHSASGSQIEGRGPSDYLWWIPKEKNLFQQVEARYRKKSYTWLKETLK